MRIEAAPPDLGVDQIIVARLTPIFRAAGCTDNDLDPTTLQDRQGVDDKPMVLVAIELIGQIEVVRRQIVRRDDL